MLRTILLGIFTIAVSIFMLTAFAQETTTTTTTTDAATGKTTIVEKKVIITPAPKSISCTTVAAHWENDIWVDTQTVCKYEGRTEGIEWVQDYWACVKFTDAGDCTNWEYRPGYWMQTKQ
jgi:hypothetical protein